MNRKLMYVVAVIMASAFALSTATAFAQFPDDSGYAEKSHKGGKDGLFKELNLTNQQRADIEAYRAKTKEATKALRETLHAKRADLKTELSKPTIDKNKVNSIVSEIKMATGQLIDQRVASILSLKQILTPEQFQKMTAKTEDRKGKRDKEGSCKAG